MLSEPLIRTHNLNKVSPRAQARAPLYDDMKKRQKKRIFTNPSLGDEEIQIYVE